MSARSEQLVEEVALFNPGEESINDPPNVATYGVLEGHPSGFALFLREVPNDGIAEVLALRAQENPSNHWLIAKFLGGN